MSRQEQSHRLSLQRAPNMTPQGRDNVRGPGNKARASNLPPFLPGTRCSTLLGGNLCWKPTSFVYTIFQYRCAKHCVQQTAFTQTCCCPSSRSASPLINWQRSTLLFHLVLWADLNLGLSYIPLKTTGLPWMRDQTTARRPLFEHKTKERR